MFSLYSREYKEVQLYMRALTSICMDDSLAYFFTLHDFGRIREGVFNKEKTFNKLKKLKINNSRELKNKLDWIIKTGWREEFQKISYLLTSLSELDRNNYINSLDSEDDYSLKVRIVNYYLNKLPVNGTLAYDYAWYIYLCRAGLARGFLTRKEAWSYMLNAAKVVQQSYPDWNEYITAYVCGHQLMMYDETFSFIHKNQKFITKLFASEYSPIRRINWNIDLDSISAPKILNYFY
ncbi:MAG: hypothetical protein K0S34_432 [Bacillales bacterium]|jgi:hypothetical protein|nr:hypothetical protein [Bacillales bacterium]